MEIAGDRWAELDASRNPFAVVTQAHLKARETAHSDEARYQAKRVLIRLQIQQRFGPLPREVEARLQEAPPEQLEAWALRMLEAASLDEVFGPDGGR